MKNDFENLITEAGAHHRLTADEREKMRYVLSEYAALKPMDQKLPAGSARRFFFASPLRSSLAGVFVLVLAFGGVAYASEGALPGSPLYGVKIAVAEPLQTALAGSPAEKASIEMALAERRIDEATQLAKLGKLSSTTEASLAANFSVHASDAAQAVSQVAKDDPGTADITASDFASRLSAYERVFGRVAGHDDRGAPVSSFDAAIHSQVLALSDSSEESPAPAALPATHVMMAPATPAAATSTATTVPERSVQADVSTHESTALLDSLQQRVDAALSVSAHAIDAASSTLGTTTASRAQSELASAKRLAAQAKARLAADDQSGAERLLRSALSAASQLEIFTRAAAKYHVDAFDDSEATRTPPPIWHGFTRATTTVRTQVRLPQPPAPASTITATTSIHAITPPGGGDDGGEHEGWRERGDDGSTPRPFGLP